MEQWVLIKVIFKREVGRSEGTETDGVYRTAIKLNFRRWEQLQARTARPGKALDH